MSLRPILGFLLFCGFSAFASAGDREDITALIEKYRVLEEKGDMLGQGALMTEDRVMVWPGERTKGGNPAAMREQQDWMDRFEAEFPGVRYVVEIRDLDLHLWTDAALATFEWYPTRIVPPELPREKAAKLPAAKTPSIIAHMLVKQGGSWKIAFSTFVPLESP